MLFSIFAFVAGDENSSLFKEYSNSTFAPFSMTKDTPVGTIFIEPASRPTF